MEISKHYGLYFSPHLHSSPLAHTSGEKTFLLPSDKEGCQIVVLDTIFLMSSVLQLHYVMWMYWMKGGLVHLNPRGGKKGDSCSS